MSTDELERIVSSALHDADHVPVELDRGRAVLVRRMEEQRRAVRRRSLIGVAASVLAIIVTTSTVVAGLRDQEQSLPVSPSPALRLSPSGLPVGTLVAEIDRSGSKVVSTVRIVVRPDGTGTFNAGTPSGIDLSTADYDVECVKAGPGRAVMRNASDTSCFSSDLLMLAFAVRGRSVGIEDAFPNNSECVVSRALASDMVGASMRILPLPQESPTGRPSVSSRSSS